MNDYDRIGLSELEAAKEYVASYGADIKHEAIMGGIVGGMIGACLIGLLILVAWVVL